jgi:ribonuclease Y
MRRLMSAGGVLCYLLLWWKDHNLREARAREAEALLTKAQADAEMIIRNAQLATNEERLKLRTELEQSFAQDNVQRAELERRLSDREVLINSQLERIVETERSVGAQHEEMRRRSEALDKREREVAELGCKATEQLQRIAHLTEAEAREAFLKKVEQDAHRDASALARRILEDARVEAEEKAKRVIALAIQRCASMHTFELTTSSVAIHGDEIKGRIIGREGRNIRAFEAATGVTVMIDDTPGAVLLSGFDPVRREIAREAMLRLIADGRIHPTRIEEVVTEVNREMEDSIVRIGEQAVMKAGVAPMHADLLRLLGRLRFRHSYAQNLLDHSIEVAQLMGLMARSSMSMSYPPNVPVCFMTSAKR